MIRGYRIRSNLERQFIFLRFVINTDGIGTSGDEVASGAESRWFLRYDPRDNRSMKTVGEPTRSTSA